MSDDKWKTRTTAPSNVFFGEKGAQSCKTGQR